MASITDNLKDGLKYPLYDPIKIVILAVLYFIVMLLSLSSAHILFNSLKNAVAPLLNTTATANNTAIANNAMVSNNLFNLIPVTSTIEIVLLLIISVIISLFITGYLYKILKSTVEGKNNIPEFNDFVNMFVDGVKVTVVGIVYSIVPIILGIIGLYLTSNTGALVTVGFIVLLIAVILGIILCLMGIMALNNMAANENSLKSAFDFKEVCALICAVGWLRFIGSIIFLVLVGIIILFATIIVSVIITLICSLAGEIGSYIGLIITLIITILVTAYLEIVTYRFYGSLYKEAIKE